MSNYVDAVLLRDETVLCRAQVSILSLLPLIVLGVLTIWAGIGLIFFIVAFIRYTSTELAITNKRVIAKTGLISRKTIELSLAKAESIQIDQGIFGRIFNYGSLVITGTGASHAPIPGIEDPLSFRKAFAEAQEQSNHRAAWQGAPAYMVPR